MGDPGGRPLPLQAGDRAMQPENPWLERLESVGRLRARARRRIPAGNDAQARRRVPDLGPVRTRSDSRWGRPERPLSLSGS